MDTAREASQTAPTDKSPDSGSLTDTAKTWGALGFAFVGALGVVGLLFFMHQRARMAELEAQYARSAAHLGHEIELKYANYRKVLDNVTPPAQDARKYSQARQLADASAARRTSTKQSLSQASNNADAAQQRLNEAQRLKQEAKQRQTTADQQEVAANLRAVSMADLAVKKAESANTSAIAAKKAAEVSDKVAGLADEAAAAAASAQEAASAATANETDAKGTPESRRDSVKNAVAAAIAKATLANQSKGDCRAPASHFDPARSGAGGRPEDLVESAKRAAAFAKEIALACAARASEKQETATRDSEELMRQLDEGFAALGAANATARNATRAAMAVQSAADAEDERKQTFELASEELRKRNAAWQRSASEAKEHEDRVASFRNRLRGQLLPSHRDILDACPQRDPDSMALCIAQRLAAESATQSGLTLVACPGARRAPPNLVSQGEAVTIPPSLDAGVAICGRVAFEDLLSPAVVRFYKENSASDRQPFEHLLLVTADGQVVWPAAAGARPRPATALSDVNGKQVRAARMATDVQVGTGRYRSFMQPVSMRAGTCLNDPCQAEAGSAAASEPDLILVGLIPESALLRESYAVSPESFLWAVLLVGFGVLSLPLAKLWLLGPKTRFRRFDVILFATSALATTLIAVIVCLAFIADNGLVRRLDQQLAGVSKDLTATLSDNIARSARLLRDFARGTEPTHRALVSAKQDAATAATLGAHCGLDWKKGRHAERSGILEHGVFDRSDDKGWPICERTRDAALSPEAGVPANAPEYKLAFWANARGYQQIKATAAARATPPIDVSERPYFKRALSNQVRCLDAGAKCTSGDLDKQPWGVPEVVRSVTTGEIVLVVARPTHAEQPAASGEDAAPTGVAAVEAHLPAFETPVLPRGFQMIVVDADGKVMLHSNNDANHGQNVFDDVRNDAELRATMTAQLDSAALTLRYQGTITRANVQRVQHANWYVITLAPKSLMDLSTADMVLLTLVGFGFVLGVMVLVMLLWLVVAWSFIRFRPKNTAPDSTTGGARPSPLLTLRPHGRYAPEYARVGLFLSAWTAAVCSVALFSLPWSATAPLLAVVVLVALLALRCVITIGRGELEPQAEPTGLYARVLEHVSASLRSTRPPPPQSWRNDLPVAYSLCCFGLAGAFVVAPATVLFGGAFDHTVDHLVRAQHAHYAGALAYRQGCIRELVDEQRSEQSSAVTIQASTPATSTGARPSAPPSQKSAAAPAPATTAPKHVRTRACCDVFGLDAKPEKAERHWLWSPERARIWWPVSWMVDGLPPLLSTVQQATGRLHARLPADDGGTLASSELIWQRGPDGLRLLSAVTRDGVWSSAVPNLATLDYDYLRLAGILAVFGAFLLAAHWVSVSSLRRLFFLDLSARCATCDRVTATDVIELAPKGCKLLVLHPPDELSGALESQGFAELLETTEPAAVRGGKWFVRDLRAGRGADLGSPALAALVLAAARGQASVVLLSGADPVRTPQLRALWAEPLEGYDVLRAQRSVHWRLAAERPTPAVLAQLWSECDEDEQRLLTQLAVDGYVNPHADNRPVLEHLVRRGLVDPHTLSISHPCFAEFVRANVSRAMLRTWETQDGHSGWSMLRVPLSTAVAAVLAGLTVSRPEMAAASATIPTLAATLPVVVRAIINVVGAPLTRS